MSSHNPQAPITPDKIEQEPTFSKSIIQNFISSLGCEFTPPLTIKTTSTLEPHIRETFHSWNLPQAHLDPLLKLVPAVCTLGDLAFHHLPQPSRTYIIILIIFFLHIDDVSENGALPELAEFTTRFARGEPQQNPVLVQYTRHLSIETPKHYGPYGTSCIIKAGLDFIIGCNLEAVFPRALPRSKGFPRFVRTKTGAGEALAHSLFPEGLFPEKVWLARYVAAVPDMVVVSDLTNDVLSFYKECVVGREENTFIQMFAESRGCSLVVALKRVGEDVVGAYLAVLEVLGLGGEGLVEVYAGFVRGFVMWHCTQERYRLSELMG